MKNVRTPMDHITFLAIQNRVATLRKHADGTGDAHSIALLDRFRAWFFALDGPGSWKALSLDDSLAPEAMLLLDINAPGYHRHPPPSRNLGKGEHFDCHVYFTRVGGAGMAHSERCVAAG